jgi:hypothetical protein
MMVIPHVSRASSAIVLAGKPVVARAAPSLNPGCPAIRSSENDDVAGWALNLSPNPSAVLRIPWQIQIVQEKSEGWGLARLDAQWPAAVIG